MNETRENGAKGTKIMATTRQGKIAHTRDSKSKQKNTAIFGAKNIDLLDLCTMSNNNTEQRNCATKQKKKRKNNRPKAESSASYAQSDVETVAGIKFISRHYSNGLWSFFHHLQFELSIDLGVRKYFALIMSAFYLARHATFKSISAFCVCKNSFDINRMSIFCIT